MVIQITDSCPECEADHIDIQALTFAKVIVGRGEGGVVCGSETKTGRTIPRLPALQGAACMLPQRAHAVG